jgi:WXG100 family type VII secretion target
VSKLAVQFDDLRSQSNGVKNGANEVHDILTKLTAQISDLASRWEGGTSEAFRQRWDDWKAGAQSVQQAMDAMGDFLSTAANTYEETENSLKTAASS